ncbi:MAG: hypothetical protein ABH864_00440 [archaeon]
MPFRDRFVVTGKMNGRFYFHTAGRDVYGNDNGTQVNGAGDYLRFVLDRNYGALKGQGVLLGALWADEDSGDRIVDVFGLKFGSEWPGNPEVGAWVAREEDLVKRENPISCAETIRVVGGEMGILMGTDSLREYMLSDTLPITGLYEGRDHEIRV